MGSKDKAATLLELKKLYDQGIITAEEFEEKRRKILDSI
nr:SHOCT domain-containing protein [Aphanothece sacrum]